MGKSGCKKKKKKKKNRGLRESWSIDAAGKSKIQSRKIIFHNAGQSKFSVIFMYLYTPDDWPLSRLSSTGILDLV